MHINQFHIIYIQCKMIILHPSPNNVVESYSMLVFNTSSADKLFKISQNVYLTELSRMVPKYRLLDFVVCFNAKFN